MRAEEEGLVTVSIQIEDLGRLMDDISRHIKNDNFSDIANAWNEERKAIAVRATKDILFPQVAKWMKDRLTNQATERIAHQCLLALTTVRFRQCFQIPLGAH